MGITSLTGGYTTIFPLFAACRLLYGLSAGAINAPIYQLIAANFPQEYRTSVNAVETSGYQWGAGIVSLSILMVAKYGWRSVYYAMGSTSLLMGLISAILVKNPPK